MRRQIKREVLGSLRKAAKRSASTGLRAKLDRGFGPNEQITERQAAIVAEAEGLPGITYGQIAKGESTLRPGAANPDDGYRSLYQMTPSVQSDETVRKWNRIARKHKGGSTNPIVAAKQAKVLAGSGTGVSNYFGTGFVTDENAHLPGGPAAARRKLRGKPKPVPRQLKRKAVSLVGEQKVKKVIKNARQGAGGPPKPLPGPWGGAQRATLKMIPTAARAEGRGDKRTPVENDYWGGADNSDHLTTKKSAYAADIPPDKKVYNAIQRKLGLPETSTGSQTVVKDGYRYQLIFGAEYDHEDHIHLGAEWVGSGNTAPTGSTSFAGAATGIPTSAPGRAAPAAPSSQAGGAPRARKPLTQADRKRRSVKQSIRRSVTSKSTPSAPKVPTFTPSTESYSSYIKKRSTAANLGL